MGIRWIKVQSLILNDYPIVNIINFFYKELPTPRLPERPLNISKPIIAPLEGFSTLWGQYCPHWEPLI